MWLAKLRWDRRATGRRAAHQALITSYLRRQPSFNTLAVNSTRLGKGVVHAVPTVSTFISNFAEMVGTPRARIRATKGLPTLRARISIQNNSQ
jgi:hypothetical protein